jgi:hypothetical protein
MNGLDRVHFPPELIAKIISAFLGAPFRIILDKVEIRLASSTTTNESVWMPVAVTSTAVGSSIELSFAFFATTESVCFATYEMRKQMCQKEYPPEPILPVFLPETEATSTIMSKRARSTFFIGIVATFSYFRSFLLNSWSGGIRLWFMFTRSANELDCK